MLVDPPFRILGLAFAAQVGVSVLVTSSACTGREICVRMAGSSTA